MQFNLCMGCMEPLEGGGVCPVCGYSSASSSLSSYLRPGTLLNDRYIIGKILSYNGEGAIYIGYDTVSSSKVTVKEYMPDTLCSRSRESDIISVRQNCVAQYKAFMSEFVELNKSLAKMRTLSHIVPPIDMFGDNNTGYVIFRYVEGVNLAAYLKDHAGELTWDEVKALFPPIFTTLSLIHNAGIIHRGISPENLLVTDRGELKLIGFSIADARTANTELASEIFEGYAAPEQYSSSNWQGTWTDVYGICALLYRILTGTTPTGAMERVANDTLPEPIILNGNIPANVSKVIMNGMNISGEMRIQTVTELVTQLFEEPEFTRQKPAASTQTISIPKQHSTRGSADPQERKTEHKRPSRIKMFWVVLASAVCVMLVSMTALMMTLDDNSGTVLNGISETTASNSSEIPVSNASAAVSLSQGSNSAVSADAEESSNISTLPTLAVIETTSSDDDDDDIVTEETAVKPGSTVYIMNDLVGKYYDTIKNTSINDNLTIIPDYVYTDEYEKGIIFEQSIAKGDNYEKGQEVVLKISMGPGKVAVPDFVGLKKKDYLEILNNAGIKYEEKYMPDENTYSGYVSWVSLDPGELIDVEAGEVLTVHIADNPQITETSETTSAVTLDTTEKITPWVTTVPPEISTETGISEPPSEETSAAQTNAEAETESAAGESDVIITIDYNNDLFATSSADE